MHPPQAGRKELPGRAPPPAEAEPSDSQPAPSEAQLRDAAASTEPPAAEEPPPAAEPPQPVEEPPAAPAANPAEPDADGDGHPDHDFKADGQHGDGDSSGGGVSEQGSDDQHSNGEGGGSASVTGSKPSGRLSPVTEVLPCLQSRNSMEHGSGVPCFKHASWRCQGSGYKVLGGTSSWEPPAWSRQNAWGSAPLLWRCCSRTRPPSTAATFRPIAGARSG